MANFNEFEEAYGIKFFFQETCGTIYILARRALQEIKFFSSFYFNNFKSFLEISHEKLERSKLLIKLMKMH